MANNEENKPLPIFLVGRCKCGKTVQLLRRKCEGTAVIVTFEPCVDCQYADYKRGFDDGKQSVQVQIALEKHVDEPAVETPIGEAMGGE